MNIFLFNNTPENHEGAKRLLKKHVDRSFSYTEGQYDYFASAMVCALCDAMSDIVGWFDMEIRLDSYVKDSSSENWLALVSGMRYAKLVYLTDRSGAKGKPGKPVFVNLIKPGEESMPEKHLLVMPLYSSKRERNTMAPDASMHQTNLKAVLKMCRNAGVDYVYLNPAYNQTVYSLENIESTLKDLDYFLDFVHMVKRAGINGEDLFELLLMTFEENYVKCKSNGKIVTGTLFTETETDEPTISIDNFKTDKEYTIPVSAIKWLKEIDRSEV